MELVRGPRDAVPCCSGRRRSFLRAENPPFKPQIESPRGRRTVCVFDTSKSYYEEYCILRRRCTVRAAAAAAVDSGCLVLVLVVLVLLVDSSGTLISSDPRFSFRGTPRLSMCAEIWRGRRRFVRRGSAGHPTTVLCVCDVWERVVLSLIVCCSLCSLLGFLLFSPLPERRPAFGVCHTPRPTRYPRPDGFTGRRGGGLVLWSVARCGGVGGCEQV